MQRKTLVKSMFTGVLAGIVAAGSALAQTIEMSSDGKSIAYTPKFPVVNHMTVSQTENADSRLPLLDNISQLPNIGLWQKSETEVTHQAYGLFFNLPFTSRSVAIKPKSSSFLTPVDRAPYRQTGKLFMTFGGKPFRCSASVIRRGLVLTAAHCVHDFGEGEAGFPEAVTFQPARHNDAMPFGEWTVKTIIIPTAYFNGSDRCHPMAPGVVCENDLAILVMSAEVNDDGIEKEIGDVVGSYGLYKNNRGYTRLGGVGDMAAHLTALGYPGGNFTSFRMIQNESIAVQDFSPVFGPEARFNQVVIGSNMTTGSSGGPWLHNFGKSDGHQGSSAVDDDRNKVAAVTSWGFSSDQIFVQGASRFGHNAAYPPSGRTNIGSLINMGCKAGRAKC